MLRSRLPGILLLMLAAAIAGCAASSPTREIASAFAVEEGRATAPFGGDVSPNIVNYTRVAPNVGLAGRLTAAGVEEAHELGFSLVIDLRQPDEDGVDTQKEIVRRIGLRYENIPLASDETAWRQVDRVIALLDDDANFPVLIHCGSANRAGALWALYRARQGVQPIVAIEEGRAGGMTSRETLVRELLELPPL